MTQNNVPELSRQDRIAALEKAAKARQDRARLRDDVKAGRVTIAEVLEMEGDVARRMKVSALIESVPGFGASKTAKLMEELGISPSRRVQGLGVRQREQLLERMGDR